MPRDADLPWWPRMLSREQAAAYLGVSPTLFDAEVAQGIWPQPIRRGAKGGRVTWDRHALDRALDAIGGTEADHTPGTKLGELSWGP